jgi:hypothetical protein
MFIEIGCQSQYQEENVISVNSKCSITLYNTASQQHFIPIFIKSLFFSLIMTKIVNSSQLVMFFVIYLINTLLLYF